MVAVGSDTTKQHQDIIGAVVSLACKIQSLAPVVGIALGHVTLQNLHTDWRTICTEVQMDEDWKYVDPQTGAPY